MPLACFIDENRIINQTGQHKNLNRTKLETSQFALTPVPEPEPERELKWYENKKRMHDINDSDLEPRRKSTIVQKARTMFVFLSQIYIKYKMKYIFFVQTL